MQSQSTLPAGVSIRWACWAIAKSGSLRIAVRSWRQFGELVAPGALQFGKGDPLLTVVADVLAVVLADRAVRRRGVARRVLGAAGDAD